MFGAENRDRFIKRLFAPRIAALAEKAKEDGLAAGRPEQPPADEPDGSSKAAARACPAMILAEDSPSFGEQIEECYVNQGGPSANNKQHQNNLRMPLSQYNLGFRDLWENLKTGNRPAEIIAHSPAREAMKRKLNHLQIQEAAEILKAKLDAEARVGKERRGGQP